MKKIIIILLMLLFAMPVFAWNEKAATESINYLNDLVYSDVHSIMKGLYVDEAQLDNIKALYKNNPQAIKTTEINNFCASCIQRNQNLLNTYKTKYFIPAYNVYKKSDNKTDFETWMYSAALSEVSEFYQFYRFTEVNLEDCQKFYNLSK